MVIEEVIAPLLLFIVFFAVSPKIYAGVFSVKEILLFNELRLLLINIPFDPILSDDFLIACSSDFLQPVTISNIVIQKINNFFIITCFYYRNLYSGGLFVHLMIILEPASGICYIKICINILLVFVYIKLP